MARFPAQVRRNVAPFASLSDGYDEHMRSSATSSGEIRMNIKTKLILAATAASLLSTPAFAFRHMGGAGDSAYAIPPNERGNGGMDNYGGWNVRPRVPATEDAASAYGSGQIIRAPQPT